MLDKSFLLVLHKSVHSERCVELGDEQNPHRSDSVCSVKWLQLPVKVPDGVFDKSGKVLEDSPFLGVVSGLLGLGLLKG